MPQDISKIVVETKDYRERNSATGRFNRGLETRTTTFYKTQSVSRRTREQHQKLKQWFSSIRFVNNPNGYTLSGLGNSFNINGSLQLAVASKVSQLMYKSVNISADIYSSATGETMIAQNVKNIFGAVTSPINYVKQATYGVWLQNMQVQRQNVGLSIQRELTNSIINTKDVGKY